MSLDSTISTVAIYRNRLDRGLRLSGPGSVCRVPRRLAKGRYHRQTLCPGDSPTIVVPDTDRQPSTITGSVVGGPEIAVDLFAANADGTRGTWLGDTSTVGGSYGFDVAPGCYVTVLIAPDGFVFAATGSRWQQMPACVEADEVLTNPDGQLRLP